MPRPRSFDEEQVLGAVREQFWEAGYAATSVDDLMEATGLGKGSLYGAFGDKRHLFLRVLDDYRAEQVAGVQQALAGPKPAWERLVSLVMAAADRAGTDDGRRGCLLVNSTAELKARDPEVLARARQTYGAIEDLLAACLREAQHEGDLRAGADTRELARLLLAVLQGVEFLGKTGMDTAALRQIAEAALSTLPRTKRRRA
jgi:AcrR family transcriptional regulator